MDELELGPAPCGAERHAPDPSEAVYPDSSTAAYIDIHQCNGKLVAILKTVNEEDREIPACYCAPGAPTMAPAEAESLAARFKALSDPTRVALINRLAGADEVCVCHLVDEFELSQPTISHHLKKLRDAGLVTAERRGTWMYYRLVPHAIDALASALDASFPREAA